MQVVRVPAEVDGLTKREPPASTFSPTSQSLLAPSRHDGTTIPFPFWPWCTASLLTGAVPFPPKACFSPCASPFCPVRVQGTLRIRTGGWRFAGLQGAYFPADSIQEPHGTDTSFPPPSLTKGPAVACDRVRMVGRTGHQMSSVQAMGLDSSERLQSLRRAAKRFANFSVTS